MHWQSFSDFLAMGGYASYVWWSFGVTALCMVIEPLLVRRQHRNLIVRLRRQIRAEARSAE
jgi:heme exporter protein D